MDDETRKEIKWGVVVGVTAMIISAIFIVGVVAICTLIIRAIW